MNNHAAIAISSSIVILAAGVMIAVGSVAGSSGAASVVVGILLGIYALCDWTWSVFWLQKLAREERDDPESKRASLRKNA